MTGVELPLIELLYTLPELFRQLGWSHGFSDSFDFFYQFPVYLRQTRCPAWRNSIQWHFALMVTQGSSRTWHVLCYFVFVWQGHKGAVIFCLASPSITTATEGSAEVGTGAFMWFENCHIASRFYRWILFGFLLIHKISYLKLKGFFALYLEGVWKVWESNFMPRLTIIRSMPR